MKIFWKIVYILSSIVEFITEIKGEDDPYDRFSDGIGGYNVSGEQMTEDEIKGHDFLTGMRDDY